MATADNFHPPDRGGGLCKLFMLNIMRPTIYLLGEKSIQSEKMRQTGWGNSKGDLKGRFRLVLACFFFLLAMAGCGSSSGGDPPPPKTTSITVTAIKADGAVDDDPFVRLDQEKLFSAAAIDGAGAPVVQAEYTWTVVGGKRNGTIAASGLYTPPSSIPIPNEIFIEVTEITNPEVKETTKITIIARGTLLFSENKAISVALPDVDTSSSGQHSTAVVGDQLFIAWTDNVDRVTGMPGDYNVYLAVSTDFGETFESVQVNDDLSGGRPCSDIATPAPCNPSLAVDLGGNAYIAWSDYRGAKSEIYFALCARDSNQVLTCNKNVLASPVGGDQQLFPTIAVSPSGDRIYVAWDDEVSNNINLAVGTKNEANAITFSDPVQVNDLSTGGNRRLQALAIGPLGTVFVVWVDTVNQQRGDIFFDYSEDAGMTFRTDVKINDDSVSVVQDVPSVAVDQDGTIFVAWEDWRNKHKTQGVQHSDIFIAKGIKSDSEGYVFLPNVQVNAADDSIAVYQDRPTLAIDPFGNILVAWEDFRNAANPTSVQQGPADIYFAKSVDGGASFGPDIRVTDDFSPFSKTSPTLATDLAGRAYLFWTDLREGNPRLYFSIGE